MIRNAVFYLRMVPAVWLFVGILSGCATSPASLQGIAISSKAAVNSHKSAPSTVTGECAKPDSKVGVQIDLIRKLKDGGDYYAALAHLDTIADPPPQARLLRAQLMRLTGRTSEARNMFAALTETCVAGHAYAGLGRLAGQAGDFKTAVVALERARRLLPIDAAVRNDLGYALMMYGERQQAARELLTAMQLAPNDKRAPANMVALLFAEGKSDAAMALVEREGFDRNRVKALKHFALTLPPERHEPVPGKAANGN